MIMWFLVQMNGRYLTFSQTLAKGSELAWLGNETACSCRVMQRYFTLLLGADYSRSCQTRSALSSRPPRMRNAPSPTCTACNRKRSRSERRHDEPPAWRSLSACDSSAHSKHD